MAILTMEFLDRERSTIIFNNPLMKIPQNQQSTFSEASAGISTSGFTGKALPAPSGGPMGGKTASVPARTPVFNQQSPAQLVTFIIQADGTKKRLEDDEEDDYDWQDGDQYDDEAQKEYDDKEREAQKSAGKAKIEEDARKKEEAKKKAIKSREDGLKKYPSRVTRRDDSFANTRNSRGSGKAHLIKEGLAPAGDVSIPHVEQLEQQSTNKGKSDLISFTGPGAHSGGTVYGDSTATTMSVKMRKLARAKAKGKADVAHLDLHTSSDILGDAGVKAADEKYSKYVKKDDEHEVRVRKTGKVKPVIPNRFLLHRDIPQSSGYDSDSDEDA